jgi:hypothetical protein
MVRREVRSRTIEIEDEQAHMLYIMMQQITNDEKQHSSSPHLNVGL